MHQADYANPFHDPMFGAAVLRAHQLDEARVAFIVHTVVDDQKRLRAVVDLVAHHRPQLPGHQPFLDQKVVDHIATHTVQVIGYLYPIEILCSPHLLLP